MTEYKRILLPLRQEKILVIAAVCSGIIAAILNLSRPIFMGLIVDNLIQRELKGAYLYIALFAGSRFLMWANNLLFDYISSKASQRILQTKRIELLRAIVSNPTLIILDEPTAGLDPGNQELVWNMIEGIGRDVTRIVATNAVERAMIADCVVVIKNGTIVECGNPRELLNCNSLYKELQTKR
ncbi:hypothetical protein [Bacillus cereus]